MNRWQRVWRHLSSTGWQARRQFPARQLARLERHIAESEQAHCGQLRFVVESALDWRAAWRGMSARQRALQWFGELRVWDTEENTGVLVYLLLAERRIEIIADRGINRRVPAQDWADICTAMQQAFAARDHVAGLELGLKRIHALLTQHAPRRGEPFVNELPDQVIVR
ncbi:TPM domain-containing protein [Chromobacterium amazonense]|uniref:TPM domain-containing protein n=1 Tax=Chromobacterium amazonense TaxID=1382803 RepID=A0ABU8V663_9NEIS|nr:TPM domain-containing protein [Chromobacterium amazonense]MBM2886174.1 TPM domain-containing protein [Chromobacterium amazonense]MDE1713387.1 TPM domain-containing protein [Chromobacterium amazonense]MDQ4540140.1 TPM domain-containing protein [Chromobacterium amazonense]